MSAREAAITVLRESSEPLRIGEITRRILRQGLWSTSGQTPEATVRAVIGEDIRRHGDASSFLRVGPGLFAIQKQGDGDSGQTLSFTEAAIKVLEEYGDKRPMHYRDITERALTLGWLRTEGITPEATMYAQIVAEIKRYRSRGEQPRFVKHGRGLFGLTRWMGQGLVFQIEQNNRRVQQSLLGQLRATDPTAFEELIARLLVEIGFEEIQVTQQSADGGIDVRGTLVVGNVIRTRMAVQAKRWRNNVQAPVVQQVRGSLGTHEQGLIITTSDFSGGATEEAQRPDAVPVALMNGEQLVALLIENDLCITRLRQDIIELEAEDETGD